MEDQEAALRALHVVPQDLDRGAQVYARALADHANQVPGERHEVAVLFAGPRVAARADVELGVPSGRLRAVGVDPRAVWRLWRVVRRRSPDVVVAHGAEAMKYVFFAKNRRRPVVLLAIGVASPKAMAGASRALLMALLRRSSLVVAVSEAVAAELRDTFGATPGDVRVIANGRDPAAFTGAPRLGASVPPRLIFVGHITRTKRPEHFIEIVSRLRARGCTFDAQMVGSGPMEAELASAAAAAGVEMLGRRSDVATLLQAASVFVFPSMAEGEGMPGVIIEAGLAGLPVIATDVPGVRDVVIDGETGCVVDEADLDGLTDAAEKLVTDESLRASMGSAARARCTELFSLQSSSDMFLKELHLLVDRG